MTGVIESRGESYQFSGKVKADNGSLGRFFYLPLMHDETLLGQIAALSLIEGLKARCGGEAEELQQFANMSLTLSEKHLRCIERFGRFPARNQALGRESSEDEIKYLEENPRGF